MKAKFFFTASVLMAAVMLKAESVDIPVLYRNPAKEAKSGQLQAFGFYENQDRIVLAFQIIDLPALVAKPKSYMSFFADADDNLETGRYAKSLGWDFQINMILTRKAVLSMLKHKGDNVKYQELSRKGCTVTTDGDMLYVTFPKSGLDGIEFKQQFKFRTLQLRNNQRVDKQKNDGVFPKKFDLPED